MADTERLINKAQGDSIISAIQGITARLQEMYTVDDAMSSSSENPVQNKVITAALDNKVDKVEGKGLSTNDYTNEEKASVANSAEQLESTQTVSGNPLTLTDAAPINAESLVVELEPKQDLHGQSAPYVGGAGKNKLPMTVDGIKAANTDGTWSGNVYAINNGTFTILTDSDGNVTGIVVNDAFNATTDFLLNPNTNYLSSSDTMILNGCPTGGNFETSYSLVLYSTSSGGGYPMADIDTGNSAQNTEPFTNGAVAIKIVSGYTASNLVFYPMIRLATETDPTFAPWSNICPITGYTECEVGDVADNLYDKSSATTGKYMNLDGTLSDWELVCYSDYIRVKPNTSYYFSHVLGSTYGLSAICFDGFKNPLNQTIGVTGDGDGNGVVTTPNDCAYIVINAMASNKDIVQITEGSTAPTTYQPYHSSNATIQFGQTVYGGRSDFTEGGTSETMGETVLDGTTAPSNSFERTNTVAGFVPIGNQKKYATTHQTKVMCDSMPVFSPDYVYVNDVFGVSENISASANGIWVSVYKDMLTSYDITGLQAWLVANNLQIAYELETNVNISTPPTDLKLLKGTNNLSTNGTTINLGYQPDNVIGEVKGEIQEIKEMSYLRILDNDIDTEIKNYRLYYRLISSSYTLVNLAEMLQHRFLFVEIIQNPSGTSNHTLLHSALIDPRTIDGFEYQMKAGTGDTVIIESNIAENKFDLSVRYTGTHTSGDPTDYYVTIRMVD